MDSKEVISAELCAYVMNNRDIVFLPTCSVCGEPITDMDDANIMVDGSPLANGPMIQIGRDHLQRYEGRVVIAHLHCDDGRRKPWFRASRVFVRRGRGAKR
jgi:hypothetical protein